MAGEHQVRGGFPVACVRVGIGAQEPGAVGADEGAAVIRLAHGLVAGGKVGDHRGPGLGQGGAGGHGGPKVLAELHPQAKLRQILAAEKQVRAKGHGLAQQGEFPVFQGGSGTEMALFIELPIIGQVLLGDDPQDAAALQ